jgi:tRNA-Thr(GGU) m(6)t(6)A37 methyltransferase TsaA
VTNTITYKPIGIVHSPFKEPKNVPIQASASHEAGSIEIYPEYSEGLRDLEGFTHIILVYHFHLTKAAPLLVKPFLDDQEHGVFATRSPSRPNPIGISIVQLCSVEGNILHVQGVDILDGTPLLDIKPYVPQFDHRNASKIGWFQEKIQKLDETKDDGRFCKQ